MSDEIEVVSIRLAVDPSPFAPLLSPDERERAARFRFDEHRRRFIVAHGALRTILGKAVDTDPQSLRFDVGPHGKPSLADSTLSFNLSHSDDLALVAMARGRRVGVDVEKIVASDDLELTARRVFTPTEQASLFAREGEERLRAFYLGWTRKEAFVKAVGDGLALPLESFDVTLAPGEPARIVAIRDAALAAESWSLFDLRTDPGYAAALVVDGAPPRVRFDRG